MGMNTADIFVGDCTKSLHNLKDGYIDCCITSPPYWGLRDYGVNGQIGQERTPDEYVNSLVDVFRSVHRVLRSDGTLWLNIGDSYAGSGRGSGGSGVLSGKQKTNKGAGYLAGKKNTKTDSGCKPKDLVGIPWMVAFALRNDGWYLRQDIIWNKPNPMPEPVKDRCTKSHEYIFLFPKSKTYYFDSDAIKEDAVYDADTNSPFGGIKYGISDDVQHQYKSGNPYTSNGFRNKRSVWTIPPSSFGGAHFATFPESLVEPCVRAGSRPGGFVLDPFSGSGTTGDVATRLGRNYVGLEINPEYAEMSKRRISRSSGSLLTTTTIHNEPHRPQSIVLSRTA